MIRLIFTRGGKEVLRVGADQVSTTDESITFINSTGIHTILRSSEWQYQTYRADMVAIEVT